MKCLRIALPVCGCIFVIPILTEAAALAVSGRTDLLPRQVISWLQKFTGHPVRPDTLPAQTAQSAFPTEKRPAGDCEPVHPIVLVDQSMSLDRAVTVDDIRPLGELLLGCGGSVRLGLIARGPASRWIKLDVPRPPARRTRPLVEHAPITSGRKAKVLAAFYRADLVEYQAWTDSAKAGLTAFDGRIKALLAEHVNRNVSPVCHSVARADTQMLREQQVFPKRSRPSWLVVLSDGIDDDPPRKPPCARRRSCSILLLVGGSSPHADTSATMGSSADAAHYIRARSTERWDGPLRCAGRT